MEGYLKNRLRVRLWNKFQETPCQLETYSAADWPGCRRARHSCRRKIHSCKISFHQRVVQNTVCCGSQFSGRRNVWLSESIDRNNGTRIDVQTLRHTREWIGLRRCERSSRHCGPTRVGGKLRHLDTHYLWIQEKAVKGDLNFKKVAGVDDGADLFTKTLSWRTTSKN